MRAEDSSWIRHGMRPNIHRPNYYIVPVADDPSYRRHPPPGPVLLHMRRGDRKVRLTLAYLRFRM